MSMEDLMEKLRARKKRDSDPIENEVGMRARSLREEVGASVAQLASATGLTEREVKSFEKSGDTTIGALRKFIQFIVTKRHGNLVYDGIEGVGGEILWGPLRCDLRENLSKHRQVIEKFATGGLLGCDPVAFTLLRMWLSKYNDYVWGLVQEIEAPYTEAIAIFCVNQDLT